MILARPRRSAAPRGAPRRAGWCGLVVVLAACGGHGSAARWPDDGPGDVADHSQLAPDDGFRPSYDAGALDRAITHERAAIDTAAGALAALEQRGDDDAARAARGDLAVQRRFLAALEVCAAQRRLCPPRLDDPPWQYPLDPDGAPPDPPLDHVLRFDRDDWRAIAAELHGRACACRTLACVDSVGFAIDVLEPRPIADVQGDEEASASITRARECLFRLRGRRLVTSPSARR